MESENWNKPGDGNTDSGKSAEVATAERLEAVLDERFDVEAIVQMVEHLDYAERLSRKLTDAFGVVRSDTNRNSSTIQSIQAEIRDMIMDVALLKRALVSTGHVGVMERRRIEKELIRELFPPSQPRQGTGLVISYANRQQPRKVDCENRLHLCKAACCRIFNVGLSPEEVESDRYDWNPRQPYALHKNRQGCAHLQGGTCVCSIYQQRPGVCQTYSCDKDQRIWADFEKKLINPDLKKRLDTLEVRIAAPYAGSPTVGPSNGHAAASLSDGSSVVANGNGKVGGVEACSIDRMSVETARALNTGDTHNSSERNRLDEEPRKKSVDPPNFDDLRELMIPLPEKKFVPPSKKDTSR